MADPLMTAVLVAIAADLTLRLTWNRWYFSRGAVPFQRTFIAKTLTWSLPHDTDLQTSLGGGIWPRMAFR